MSDTQKKSIHENHKEEPFTVNELEKECKEHPEIKNVEEAFSDQTENETVTPFMRNFYHNEVGCMSNDEVILDWFKARDEKDEEKKIEQICDNPEVNSIKQTPTNNTQVQEDKITKEDEELLGAIIRADEKEDKPNWNGGYIEASQEAYELLIAEGHKDCVSGYEEHRQHDAKYLFIDSGNRINSYSNLKALLEYNPNHKQFYINNGTPSWNKPKSNYQKLKKKHEINPNAPHRQDEETQINSMEDLNELPIVGEETDISFYKDLKNGDLLYSCADISISELQEDLKTLPQNQRVKVLVNAIVEPKKEIQFPALMTTEYKEWTAAKNEDTLQALLRIGWRLATKEEHASLFYQGKV